MKKISLLLILGFVLIGAVTTFAADGLIALKSSYSADETMNRFEAIAKKKGLNIFARIDHAAGAKKIGKTLPDRSFDLWQSSRGDPVYGVQSDCWDRSTA